MFWPKFLFILMMLMTLLSAGFVAFSKNLLYSAFALLATFLGMAGMYILLGADFLGATQVVVYAGGILILILFGVMLTNRIENVKGSNVSTAGPVGIALLALATLALVGVLMAAPWVGVGPDGAPQAASAASAAMWTKVINQSTVDHLGKGLLLRYVLPFEAVSITLLAALIGAVVIVRKEIRPQGGEEQEEE